MLEQSTLYVILGALAIVLATITLAVIKVRAATKNANKGNNNNKQYSGNRSGPSQSSLQRKERELKKRERNLGQRKGVLKQQEKIISEKKTELDNLISEETEKLSKISGLSKEKAKKNLMDNLKKELVSEMAQLKERIEEESRKTVNEEISELIEESLRKHAEESGTDLSFSVFMLPRPEIKSWVIGSSGRNIRTFESTTGAKLVISQFSDAVVISSTNRNKVRMAEVALDELISLGKITPELIMDKVAHLKEELVEFFDEDR